MNRQIGFLAAALAVTAVSFPAVATAQSHGGHGAGHGMASGQSGQPGEVKRTIDIVIGDNYFEPENIEVKPGETVRFSIENRGAFVHEFNIGTPALHAEHQKEMQMMVDHGVLMPDRINHQAMQGGGHSMNHDIPNSILLEPGKTGEIVWQFGSGGEPEIACNVPGHYDSGMSIRVMMGH